MNIHERFIKIYRNCILPQGSNYVCGQSENIYSDQNQIYKHRHLRAGQKSLKLFEYIYIYTYMDGLLIYLEVHEEKSFHEAVQRAADKHHDKEDDAGHAAENAPYPLHRVRVLRQPDILDHIANVVNCRSY